MRRTILFVLLVILVAALPLWPFNDEWTYGPAITVAFFLIANLMVPVVEFLSRWREFHSGQMLTRWREGRHAP